VEKQNNTFHEIWEKLKSCKKIAMTLHTAPDGDSLGSCLAMKYVLEKEGVEIKLVSYGKVPKSLDRLSIVNEVEFGKDISELDENKFDSLLILDVGSLDYASQKLKKEFNPKNFLIMIDHHISNTSFGDMNYVDKNKASTCSLLIDFFKEVGVEVDKELANRLLIGVCTDSGYFTFENGQDALKDAAFLISKGADYLDFLFKTFYDQSLSVKKFYSLVIENFKSSEDGRLGYSVLSFDEIKNLGLNEAEVRLGINELKFLEGFDFVFNLIELEDHIKGSFRSSKIDTTKFAKELGGGGHKAASAFRLSKMPLNEALEKVLDVIERVEGKED